MLEKSIERFFQEIADREQPQSRISAQQAIRDGRTRLRRRRRLRAIGTPAFAAVAVLAIAVSSSSLSAGSHGAGPGQGRATATAPYFSTLAPWATFGWLPAKEPVIPGRHGALAQLNTNGQLNPVSENITSGAWTLEAYAVGECHQVRNQVQPGAASEGISRYSMLDCGKDQRGNDACTLTREEPAPPVNGHPAFWIKWHNLPHASSRCLNFEYAPGGWASLGNDPRIYPSKQVILRVASAVRSGGQPTFKFAAQIRNLPGKWRVFRINFYVVDGALLASDYGIRDGATKIDIHFTPANAKHNKCERFHTSPRPGGPVHICRVINGYYVNATKNPKSPTLPSCPPG
ncbi:MAG TPA: hypothetical protein VNW50_24205, partial [Streptosporangiaceae bacterium]|nr:hypothetical protein [Streptosporangiaceae bacterium]